MKQPSVHPYASRRTSNGRPARPAAWPSPLSEKAPGSALIGLVVAILVFSVLAAAIVPMIGSSGQQAALADAAAQAYLMAESGFRYAASEFLWGGDTDAARNNTLESLDGNYTLSDGQSRFELKVYSYFYEVLSVDNSSPPDITIYTHAPGSTDVDEVAPAGSIADRQIRIGDETYTLEATSSAGPGEDANVTMIVSNPISTPAVGSVIYPAATAINGQAATIAGQNTFNIICQDDDLQMFPRRNGRINVNGVYLTYRLKDGDTLVDIRNPDTPDTPLAGLVLPANSPIVLAPHVRLVSTGAYGRGGAEVSRTVVYHTPLTLPGTSARQVEFTDTFQDKLDWEDTTGTDTAAGAAGVSGDSALAVGEVAEPGGSQDRGSLTAFKPFTDEAREIDFNASRSDAGGFLSYETQLKIGYQDINPDPPLSYFPASPIPSFAAAGLAFRLGGLDPTTGNIFNVNTYGISFLRGDETQTDGIPDEIVPVQGERLMVLWQQTGGGGERNWLAYKELADFHFEEDFEITNKFHQQIGTRWDPEENGRQRGSSTFNWYYGNDDTHNYDFGDTDFGVIQSDEITLPAGLSATLSFWSWHETEPGRQLTHDLKQVFVREVGPGDTLGPRIEVRRINDRGDAPDVWYQEWVDLSTHAGETIRIEFGFDTVDSLNNAFEGWYIDDVRVFYSWPVQESTLGVRLQEAVVVPFVNGTPQIRQGDRIFGNTRGTVGTVLATPMVTSGNWTAISPAQGTLLLSNVASPLGGDKFNGGVGEVLRVIAGDGRAVVSSDYDDDDDKRANIIRVYYATANGSGSGVGNNNPLDENTEPYGRLGVDPVLTDLQWPPDLDGDGNWTDDDGNWTDTEDYFRLIEWDAVNTANVDALSTIPFRSDAQGLVSSAVIQSAHPNLESPLIFGSGNPELGLHTFGDGAETVFFDDFGIRLLVGVEDIVPIAVQQ